MTRSLTETISNSVIYDLAQLFQQDPINSIQGQKVVFLSENRCAGLFLGCYDGLVRIWRKCFQWVKHAFFKEDLFLRCLHLKGRRTIDQNTFLHIWPWKFKNKLVLNGLGIQNWHDYIPKVNLHSVHLHSVVFSHFCGHLF